MNIKTQCRGFKLSLALHDHVKSRIYLVLGRYSSKIRQVEVTLLDVNGPKGGVDKKCLITLRLNHFKSIVVQETSEDMYFSINNCAQRARRAVERHYNRMRDMHRKPHHGYA